MDRNVYNSIDFAIHVWSMFRFNDGGIGTLVGEVPRRWELHPATTLNQALNDHVPIQNAPLLENNQVFSALFTLRDIHTLGDFVIQPTDNILQHLYVEKFRGRSFRVTVFIFFHASVLVHLRNTNLE